MRKFALSWIISLSLLIFTFVQLQAGRPFETEITGIQNKQRIKIDLGIDYSHLASQQDLVAFPWFGLNFSTGQFVEIQAYYDFFYRFTQRATTVYGSGDLSLWTKIRFVEEKRNRPALGLRFGVKLPNAKDEVGLGTDQTNFYAAALMGKSVGRFENHLNLGIAIYDNPFRAREQKDLFTAAFVSSYNLSQNFQILLDFYSQQGSDPRFNLNKLTLGTRINKKNWVWEVALKKGIHSINKGFQGELSLDWGLVVAASRYFDLK
ncbi:MAG: hypothetical protein A2145_02960 [candidate division Zixibacteria bacterium RBG_16_40_9]|nr:MAG: hypothetical protein A2145_02960 [candidate division Zixibacteria bacterium RBG_16_40_9]